MTNFKELVEAVEENNCPWSEWNSYDQIECIYGKLSSSERANVLSRIFLDLLIRDNGENLEYYQYVIDCEAYGYPFSRGNSNLNVGEQHG